MKIFVSGLRFDETNESLLALFNEFGPVTEAFVVRNRETGDGNKGYGFVTFEKDEDAQLAIKEMEGAPHRGRKLHVDVARPRSTDPVTGG